jgi:predicted RNase H-like HicB family nuclease
MKYAVRYERAKDGGWGAYSPDLPGVGIVASTKDEARESIAKAIAMHAEDLRGQGLALPAPSSVGAEFIDVA